MFNLTLTAEQRVSKAVMDIMANPKYVALAGVLMIGERTVDDDVPTACTNGRDEKYGRAFVESLTDPELRFLILHETYHKLYRHLTTWLHLYKDDPELANQACDHVINLKIAGDNTDGWAKLPEGGLCDSKFSGMDSAQVFHALKQEQDEQDSGGSGGEGEGEGSGMDSHDWDGAQELSEADKQELARDIDEAIRQGAMVAGKLGSGGDRSLDELLQPQVDWREVLREFVSATCAGNDYSTWSRPNRRYVAAGYYMPSGISETVDELVLAIDTSGSIGRRELTAFLSEVKAVCDTAKPARVRVLYWDTEVCRDETYTMDDLHTLPQSTKPAGGGGTDVGCVTSYMAEHGIKPQACIVLTDGYLGGSWGQWSCPVLWTLLDNASARPPVGKYVHIKSNTL